MVSRIKYKKTRKINVPKTRNTSKKTSKKTDNKKKTRKHKRISRGGGENNRNISWWEKSTFNKIGNTVKDLSVVGYISKKLDPIARIKKRARIEYTEILNGNTKYQEVKSKSKRGFFLQKEANEMRKRSLEGDNFKVENSITHNKKKKKKYELTIKKRILDGILLKKTENMKNIKKQFEDYNKKKSDNVTNLNFLKKVPGRLRYFHFRKTIKNLKKSKKQVDWLGEQIRKLNSELNRDFNSINITELTKKNNGKPSSNHTSSGSNNGTAANADGAAANTTAPVAAANTTAPVAAANTNNNNNHRNANNGANSEEFTGFGNNTPVAAANTNNTNNSAAATAPAVAVPAVPAAPADDAPGAANAVADAANANNEEVFGFGAERETE